MNFMQRHKILTIRQHFEEMYDTAFEKAYTTTGQTEQAAPEEIANALRQAYAQGVLKAIDLILAELELD
jgi:hypothetical protein